MTTTDRYRATGVDLEAADQARLRIRDLVTATHTRETLNAFGAFGGTVRVPPDIERPALALSTDGVGTKVLVAIQAGRHDTVGEDLVNHSVNDILVQGATPLAFLDYIAGSGLTATIIEAIVTGVARGCRTHSMSLVGGETAQLPDMYAHGHYDLAGTIVGVVSEGEMLPREIAIGDQLVAYASTGLHTNGYTLARNIVFKELGLDVHDEFPELNRPVRDVLLDVHASYWSAVAPVLDRVHGLAHITGGGIPGNLVRSLPTGCGAKVHRGTWEPPTLFRVLQNAGRVHDDEMFRVFNMGIGMIGILGREAVGPVRKAAADAQIETWVVGEVVAGEGVEISR